MGHFMCLLLVLPSFVVFLSVVTFTLRREGELCVVQYFSCSGLHLSRALSHFSTLLEKSKIQNKSGIIKQDVENIKLDYIALNCLGIFKVLVDKVVNFFLLKCLIEEVPNKCWLTELCDHGQLYGNCNVTSVQHQMKCIDNNSTRMEFYGVKLVRELR